MPGNRSVNKGIPFSFPLDLLSFEAIESEFYTPETMLPEVFECPQCQRQFVFELLEGTEDHSIHCPQCKRYLGEKDIHFILVTEIEELTERLRFERERLEKDEAIYSMTDCEAELRLYGSEIHKVVGILRKAMAELEELKRAYL